MVALKKRTWFALLKLGKTSFEWNTMSTGILYQGFGISGYNHRGTDYVER